MLEHQRAADELLQGLLVPSNSHWRRGAERLATAELHPGEWPFDRALSTSIRGAETRVHELAARASEASTVSQRERARALFTRDIPEGDELLRDRARDHAGVMSRNSSAEMASNLLFDRSRDRHFMATPFIVVFKNVAASLAIETVARVRFACPIATGSAATDSTSICRYRYPAGTSPESTDLRV